MRQHFLLKYFFCILNSLFSSDTNCSTTLSNVVQSNLLILNDKSFLQGWA
uniref:DNA-directed RNA polymerase II subunit, putative n=1 Tax=Arundo donax TaxID=35708 RepID=A0A0A9D593_ARUDO